MLPSLTEQFQWCYAAGDVTSGALLIDDTGSWLRASRERAQVFPADTSRLNQITTGSRLSPRVFLGARQVRDVWFAGWVWRKDYDSIVPLLQQAP